MKRRRRNRTRPLRIEHLSARELLAGDLQNRYEPLDVNGDLKVTAFDALWVINRMGSSAASKSEGMPDVNGNGSVTAMDALLVVNALSSRRTISVMRLANDTGPGGTTNNDAITSDLTVEGRIAWPTAFPTQTAFLTATTYYDSLEYISLDPYLDGSYFHIPSVDLRNELGSAIDFDTGELLVELRSGSNEPDWNSEPLAQISVRFDNEAPRLITPDWISADAERLKIYIDDKLAVGAISRDPLANDGISFKIADEKLPFQWQETSDYQLIDVAIGEVSGGADGAIPVITDAVIEDLAGNQTVLPQRLVVQRTDAPSLLDFVTPEPDTGHPFFAEGISANPGQLIRLPVPPFPLSQRIIVPTADRNDDYALALSEHSLSPKYVDTLAEEAIYRLPSNAVSGPIRDESNRVIAELHVVPGTPALTVSDGVWDIPYRPAGIDPSNWQYRYRFPTGDQIEQTEFDPNDVANWPSVAEGDAAPSFGFQPIQLAGDGGVSEPFSLGFANPNLGEIWSILPDGDEQHYWMGIDNRLVNIDPATAGIVDEIEFVRKDDQSDLFPDQSFSVRHLQYIPAETLAPAVEFFGAEPNDTTGHWAVAFVDSLGSGVDRTIVIDLVSGDILGTLPYQGTPLELSFYNRRNVPPVYHPELGSWFEVTSDGRYIREYSLATGTQVREEPAIGAHSWTVRPHRLYALGLMAWDVSRQQMVLFRDEGVNVFDPTSYAFSTTQDYPNVLLGSSRELTTDIAIGRDGLVLFSRSDGIFDRYQNSNQTSPASGPVVTKIVSVARRGEPADPSIPSANPEQLIEVHGENLDASGFRLEFPRRGVFSSIRYEAGVISRSPVHVAKDGARAWFVVPEFAATGLLTVRGDAGFAGLQLQIVPTVSYQSRGVGIDEFELRHDGQLVNHCLDRAASRDCGKRLSFEVLPEPRQTRQITTDDGSTTRHVNSSEQSYGGERWEIGSLVSAIPRYGANFEFDLPSENWVAASSDLTFDATAKPGFESEELPSHLRVDFISETEGVRRYQQISAARQGETSHYKASMPADFPGGEVVITGAEDGDSRLHLQVASTVIAASGDSTLVGSAILVAGVNLAGAKFFIDDLPVAISDLSSWGPYSLDLLRLVVPDGATDGVLRIEDEQASAVLDRLEPWWLESEMPTPASGTPTFNDLPSINFGQTFSFRTTAAAEDFRFQYFNDRLTVRTPSRDFVDVTTLDEQQIRLDVDPLFPPTTYLFRESSSSLWSILVVIPDPSDLIEVPSELNGSDIDAVGFTFDDAQGIEQMRIDWGDRSWQADYDRRYYFGAAVVGGRYSNLYLFEDSRQSPASRISFIPSFIADPPTQNWLDVAFVQDEFQTLPEGPIRFSTPWGATENGQVEIADQAALDAFANQLSAEKGTPADPSLPSVNAGQLIDVPPDVADRLSVAYLSLEESASNGQTEPVWHGIPIQSNSQLRIPQGGGVGEIRMGLFGNDLPIQIVPSIEPLGYNSYTYRDGLEFSIRGANARSSLRIGDREAPLTSGEVSNRLRLSILDPRYRDLTREDFDAGIQVVSPGGQSDLVYPKMISRIVPATPSLFPSQDPNIPAVAPRQLVRVEGHHLSENDDVSIDGRSTNLFDVSPDGRTAKLLIPTYSGWDVNGIRTLRYEDDDVYWALQELPINIIVAPDSELGPVDLVALDGLPADPSKPSANAGQTISLKVALASPIGYTVEYPVFNTDTNQVETFTRSTGSPTGLPQIRAVTLLYGTANLIPISGEIKLRGFDASIEYQLVPQVWNIEEVAEQSNQLTVTLRGTHSGNTQLFWDDQLVYSFDPQAAVSDEIVGSWVDPRTVTLTFDSEVFGSTPPQGTVRVETDGGSDERDYS